MIDSDRRSEIHGRIWEARDQFSAGVRYTPEVVADLRTFGDGRCRHEGQFEIVRYRVSGGASQARKCCLSCGDVFGGAVRPIGTPPFWDTGKLVIWVERRITELRTLFERHAAQQAAELTEMRADHAAYLQSPEWRERRRKVLERAHGLCEGCRSNRATQVHHLTYKHWGRELLFELVALCDACHAVCHEDRKEIA